MPRFTVPRFLVLLLMSLMLPLQAAEQIRVVGSTSVLPILAEAAKQYRQAHPEVRLTVSGGGSGVGVNSVAQGMSEIGMLSRDLTEREKQRLQGKAELLPVARDAVAIAVSKAVYEAGVTQLSLAQIAAIYRGEINNWRDVGGPDARILVIDKEASRGTRHVFAKVVLGNEKARAPGASIITGSNNEEQAAIANSDQAIGMLSNAWLNDQVRAVAIGAGEQALLPTAAHIASGAYPISRELNILVPQGGGQQVMAFIDYLRSADGQKIVEQVGYLPVFMPASILAQ